MGHTTITLAIVFVWTAIIAGALIASLVARFAGRRRLSELLLGVSYNTGFFGVCLSVAVVFIALWLGG
ncbi:MAG: hypothetical protein AAF586_07650 [Planctomycetota bacterium]